MKFTRSLSIRSYAYSRSIRANFNWSRRNGTERSNPSLCLDVTCAILISPQTNTTRIIPGRSIVPIELEKSFEMNAIKRDATTTGRQRRSYGFTDHGEGSRSCSTKLHDEADTHEAKKVHGFDSSWFDGGLWINRGFPDSSEQPMKEGVARTMSSFGKLTPFFLFLPSIIPRSCFVPPCCVFDLGARIWN